MNSISQFAQFEPTCDIRFSVIINTDNRLEYLKRTLSGLRYQKYTNFEVCIVCGPTPDGTRDYVRSLTTGAKVAHCEERNLSRSRNIGIAMAAGDIVAFIDDDSVPEAEWLADLARSYTDISVGAVGGFVYDHTGVRFQAEYVTIDRLGYPAEWSKPVPHLNFPFSQEVPHLLGTNCSFRRSVLLEVGGFDEEYEYFLEETDLCCRINDAGYKIVQRADAFVHHKFAPSHLRNSNRVVKNWYPLIKNRIYFGIRNGLNHHSIDRATAAGLRDGKGWEIAVIKDVAKGDLTQDDLNRFYQEAKEALRDGHARGLEPAKYLKPATLADHQSPFAPYAIQDDDVKDRVVCLVTEDYPPAQDCAMTRRFSQLAHSLANKGHHVHVLTAAQGPATLDFEEGVWVHRLGNHTFPAPFSSSSPPSAIHGPVWDHGGSIREEVLAINRRRKVDLVYCPSTDGEPLAFLLDGQLPLSQPDHANYWRFPIFVNGFQLVSWWAAAHSISDILFA